MKLYLVVRVEELCRDSEAQPLDCLPGVEASRLRLHGLVMQFNTDALHNSTEVVRSFMDYYSFTVQMRSI